MMTSSLSPYSPPSLQSSTLSSLFETLVPIASIATISVVIGYTLPRGGSQQQEQLKHYSVGLVSLGWWTISVALSLNYQFFSDPKKWNDGDGIGLSILVLVPIIMISILYYLLFVGDVSFFMQNKQQRKRRKHRKQQYNQQSQTATAFLILDQVPLWAWIILHVYRLDGAFTIVYAYRSGIDIPQYLGLQTLFLDVLLGATSLPLAWLVYRFSKTNAEKKEGGRDNFDISKETMRNILWFWNSLGLYDLTSAYILLILNFFRFGPHIITEPALSIVGFHPLPLVVLFQAPLAIAIHILFLTYLIERFTHTNDSSSISKSIRNQTTLLPLHIQELRDQQRQ